MADAAGDAPVVLVHADPEAFLLPGRRARLVSALGGARGARPPPARVERALDARTRAAVPPFLYLTPTLLDEAVAAMAARGEPLRAAAARRRPSSPCGGTCWRDCRRRSARCGPRGGARAGPRGRDRSRRLPAPLRRDGRVGARGPRGAGPAGRAGRARRRLLAGRHRSRAARAGRRRASWAIEPDAEDAAPAARVYDRVIAGAARGGPRGRGPAGSTPSSSATCSSTSRTPPTRSIACGPGSRPEGVVVASVPNVGTLVRRRRPDRGDGSTTCPTRCSPARTSASSRAGRCTDLFEASGYARRRRRGDSLPASPRGRAARAPALASGSLARSGRRGVSGRRARRG